MTQLTVRRAEAESRIQAQVAKGEALLEKPIRSKAELEEAQAGYYTWTEYNAELLKKLFTAEDEAESYARFAGLYVSAERTLAEEVEEHRDDLRSKLRRLASVLERLELFDEPGGAGEEPDSQEAVAKQLLETLDAIKAGRFQDDQLIRQAKILNARLAPTYTRMYGHIPEITTTYPTHVWWPRAYDFAEQALAMASAREAQYSPRSAPPQSQLRVPSDRVFIVHGRDDGLKEAVARLIDRLGFKPVILHERPDRGQTIIEKFEREVTDAAFAIVLLTPDDEGGLRTKDGSRPDPHRPRARQNVVWEHGYFVALIGRDHVAALVVCHDELERPSDLHGLMYIPVASIDDQNWRMHLAREMKAAGLQIDLNEVG